MILLRGVRHIKIEKKIKKCVEHCTAAHGSAKAQLKRSTRCHVRQCKRYAELHIANRKA